MRHNRREFLVSSSLLAGAMVTRSAFAHSTRSAAQGSGRMKLRFRPYTLALKHTFTIATDHTIIIDERPGLVHTLWIPGLATGRGAVASTTAADTGISMRANTIFLDAGVNVTNPSTKGSTYATWLKYGGSIAVYLGGVSAGNAVSVITSLDTSVLGYTSCSAVTLKDAHVRTTSQDSAKSLYIKHGGSTFDGWIWINFIGR